MPPQINFIIGEILQRQRVVTEARKSSVGIFAIRTRLDLEALDYFPILSRYQQTGIGMIKSSSL